VGKAGGRTAAKAGATATIKEKASFSILRPMRWGTEAQPTDFQNLYRQLVLCQTAKMTTPCQVPLRKRMKLRPVQRSKASCQSVLRVLLAGWLSSVI
jgi:hypothetical protein